MTGTPARPASVAAFTGHRLDEPGREPPRFPPEKEGAVREAIRDCIRKLDVGYGFSSAACGGDILFLEELLEQGGSPRVWLPFPAEAFEVASVGPWGLRFRRIIADRRVRVRIVSDEVPPEDERPRAFAACSRAIREEAVRFAHGFGRVPVLVALWNGRTGDGRGGTADTVDDWIRADLPVEILPIPGAGGPEGEVPAE